MEKPDVQRGESLRCNIFHEEVAEWLPVLLMGFLWVVCERDTQPEGGRLTLNAQEQANPLKFHKSCDAGENFLDKYNIK